MGLFKILINVILTLSTGSRHGFKNNHGTGYLQDEGRLPGV